MSLTFRCSLPGALLFAAVSGASAQEELIGGGVFRAPNWSMPIMLSYQLPGSTTNANYNGPIGWNSNGSGSTVATARQVPLPISGSISGLMANYPSGQGTSPNFLTVTSNINGTDGTVTCQNQASTGSAPFTCSDTTHADTINAGDLFQWHWDPHTSTWAQGASPSQIAAMLTTTGQAGAWLIGPTGVTLGTSAAYYGPNAGTAPTGTTTTESQMSAIMPIGGTITGIFATPNASAGTDPWVFTVCQNGTAGCASPNIKTGMYCQLTASSTNGCCATVNGVGHVPGLPATACGTTTAITFAAGDTISVQVGCPGSAGAGTGGGTDCPAITPGIGIAYVPAGGSQAILTAQGGNNNNPAFTGVQMSNLVATQINYQITPQMGGRNLVFGNFTVCENLNPGASPAGRVFTAQTSTGPPTLPTNTSVALTMNTANGACLGANSATFLGGARDNVSNWVVGSGGLAGYAGTSTGAPATGNQTWKLAATAAIQ